MRKITKEKLTDVQQEISDAYYKRAKQINEKHTINNRLKTTLKISGVLAGISIVGSILNLGAFTVLLWLITTLSIGVGMGFGVAKYNNALESNELTDKINELEQLQKDMVVDYNIKAENKIDINVLNKSTLKAQNKLQNELTIYSENNEQQI